MSVATKVKAKATYEDLKAVPDHLVAEILAGDLYTSPRPAARHARAATRLLRRLGAAFFDGDGGDGDGGWEILFEPELHLGADVLVPDLAGWRIERMPTMPDVAFFELAPDWVCEVISPSTAIVDRTRKLEIYGREGVPWLWFVSPRDRLLEVLRNTDTGWNIAMTAAADKTVEAPPFDAIELALADLWLPQEPPAST